MDEEPVEVSEQEYGSRRSTDRRVSRYSTFTEYIDKELLPHALVWGIPYDVFFCLDLNSIKPFQRAYRLRCEEKAEAIKHSAWFIGRYVCESIATCFSKNHSYPEKPFESKDKTEDGEAYVFRDADRFQVFAMAYNKHRNKNVSGAK